NTKEVANTNFLQVAKQKVSDRLFHNAYLLSELGSRFDSSPLGPDVMENECSDSESDQNTNDTVANFIKVCVGCVALEHAEEKSESDLETGVADAFASGRDPAGNCADCGNEHNKRRD